MAEPRKHYSNAIKAKAALEAIKGQKTANEISSEYGVHSTQIAQWKKQVLDAHPIDICVSTFWGREERGGLDCQLISTNRSIESGG